MTKLGPPLRWVTEVKKLQKIFLTTCPVVYLHRSPDEHSHNHHTQLNILPCNYNGEKVRNLNP